MGSLQVVRALVAFEVDLLSLMLVMHSLPAIQKRTHSSSSARFPSKSCVIMVANAVSSFVLCLVVKALLSLGLAKIFLMVLA